MNWGLVKNQTMNRSTLLILVLSVFSFLFFSYSFKQYDSKTLSISGTVKLNNSSVDGGAVKLKSIKVGAKTGIVVNKEGNIDEIGNFNVSYALVEDDIESQLSEIFVKTKQVQALVASNPNEYQKKLEAIENTQIELLFLIDIPSKWLWNIEKTCYLRVKDLPNQEPNSANWKINVGTIPLKNS